MHYVDKVALGMTWPRQFGHCIVWNWICSFQSDAVLQPDHTELDTDSSQTMDPTSLLQHLKQVLNGERDSAKFLGCHQKSKTDVNSQ